MATRYDPHRWLMIERPPSVDDVEQTTLSQFRDVLSQWFESIIQQLLAGEIPLTSEFQVRARIAPAPTINEAFDLVFEAMWKDGAQAGREAAARRHGFDIDFSITRPEVETALEENAERAEEQVTNRMTGDITDTMLELHEEGAGIDEIARRLNEDVFPDMKRWQARRIAQTEVISASNKGNLTAYRDASGVTGKKWLATDDERTRPSHNHADGQVVLIGQPFIVDGNQAEYPGDPSLPPSERINCRCAVAPVVSM